MDSLPRVFLQDVCTRISLSSPVGRHSDRVGNTNTTESVGIISYAEPF